MTFIILFFTIPIILVLLSIWYYNFYLLRKEKDKKSLSGILKKKLEKENKKAKQKQVLKYPQFIPFYEWHGFLNGLHPESLKWYLTNGKQGIKPKRWNNERTKTK